MRNARMLLSFSMIAGFLLAGPARAATLRKLPADEMILTQQSGPSAPPSGKNTVYAKSDNNLYIKNSSGVESAVGSAAANGLATLTSAVTRVEWARLGASAACASSPCVLADHGGGVTSVTRSATGIYSINFATNFTQIPFCIIESNTTAGSYTDCHADTICTVSACSARCYLSNSGGTASDGAFNAICLGQK